MAQLHHWNTHFTPLGGGGSTQAFARSGLGWRHTKGDVDPSWSMVFITDNAALFSIVGAPITKDVAAVNREVGVQTGENTTVA